MTAKPAAPPRKGVSAGALATVILIVLGLIVAFIIFQADIDFGVPLPNLDNAPPAIQGGDGAGPAAGEGQPDNCRKGCKDDNP